MRAVGEAEPVYRTLSDIGVQTVNFLAKPLKFETFGRARW